MELREAAQMALDALESSRVFVTSREKIKHPEGTEWYDERIEALRAALAQPEQEPPCATGSQCVGNKCERCAVQPEQEPVAWMHDSHVGFNVPLYTAPPQRDWQGLTDEEIEKLVYDIRSQTTGVVATVYVARAIEAKLREKNT